MSEREAIRDFLAQRRIAVIGVSRDPKEFSAGLFRTLRQAGYDAIPVNPNTSEIDGVRCVARVQDITPAPDAALVMVPKGVSPEVVKDCSAAGIRRIWLYGVKGPKCVSAQALALCREFGMTVVPGYCTHMFLPGTAWFHRLHGGIAKLVGQYPR